MQFQVNFTGYTLRLARGDDQVTRVFDPIRKKWIVLTPEEHVRQYLLQHLLIGLGYPAAKIAVEKSIRVSGKVRRFDVVVYNQQHQPWMLAECKAPEIPIGEPALYQLLQYQQTIQGQYWVLCNGIDCLCADARNPLQPVWMASFPAYGL